MSLNILPFLGIAVTRANTVGGAAGATTMPLDSTAIPYTSARIVNAGTAAAFIQFIDTTNTVTVGVTNAIPIFATSAIVLATGGKGAIAFNTTTTLTTTIFVTAGTGGPAR